MSRMPRLRTIALVGMASTMLFPAAAFAAKGGRNNNALVAAPGCAVQAVGSSPTWLDVTATGLTPGTLYQVTVVQPSGATTGDLVYPAADGSLHDSNNSAAFAGHYDVSISKVRGSTLFSCSTDVG